MDRSLSALAPHVADAVVWHDGKSFHPGGFHSFSGIVGKNHVVPMSCKCEGVSCLWNAQFRLQMHGIGLRLTEVTQSAHYLQRMCSGSRCVLSTSMKGHHDRGPCVHLY